MSDNSNSYDSLRYVRGESLSKETDSLLEAIDDVTQCDRLEQINITSEESLNNLTNIVDELPGSKNDVPAYISEAAVFISEALSFEQEENYEESLLSYRAAIGKLLSGVVSDSSPVRAGQVKRRIAGYISKAEALVREGEGRRARRNTRKEAAIPHLQLFGQIKELREYKVKNILVNKIIVAEHLSSGQVVVFKTLHKSPAVYKKSKTSLLPINIAYMVRLLKYFETDDCVYLMLEYCSAGRLWDVVKPLVFQSFRSGQESQEGAFTRESSNDVQEPSHTPVKRKTSVIKASESFIHDRKISINENVDSESSSDSLEDISVVHNHNDSMVVVSNEKIEHIDGYEEEEKLRLQENVSSQNSFVKKSQKMLVSISRTLNKPDAKTNDMLKELDGIESKIKQHLKGEISPVKVAKEAVESAVPLNTRSGSVSESTGPVSSQAASESSELESRRPPVLRKLSELLPHCCEQDPRLLESTLLPDRLIRTWAAEIAQVLFSLHYREVLVRDLHPANLLLDSAGHVKLSYQCQWVSVDSSLSPEALTQNFCAPEVVAGEGSNNGTGDLTPAADWWSYGAILHLLYTGQHPSSCLSSGVDSSIPLAAFPPGTEAEVRHFIGELLQPQPELRLGAGTTGSNDIKTHRFFREWNWNTMSWTL